MKFLLISPKNRTVYNFRGDLIKEIIKNGYEVVVTGPDNTDVHKIEDLGAKFVRVPMNKNATSIFGDLKYLKGIYKCIKSEKVDVTLAYTVKPIVFGAIAAAFAGVKNINSMVTGGGYIFTSKSFNARFLRIVVSILYKISFSLSKNVIFQNSDDRKYFCKNKLVKPQKCFVVNGSGVNLERFTKAPIPEKITFFMLSRLLKSKGVLEYLKAAEIVKKDFPNVRFCLLGKYETNMRDAFAKEDIEYFVKKGVVERFDETDDVRPYYAMSSVFVLPSYREGVPRSVLEAMAMGRPIITTDVIGCRETVKDGETGFLVEHKSVNAIAEKMLYFIRHPEMIESMGSKSRAYAEEKFDVKLVNSDILKIINITSEF